MRLIHKIAMLSAGAAIAFTGVSDAGTKSTSQFGVYVNVTSSATLALSGTTFTWNAIKPTINSYVLASSGPMTITGGMRTSPTGGTGSIVIMSPGNIQGQNKVNNTLAIKSFALTCSGTGNTGTPPKYAPALTNLVANSTVPCATWGAGATTKLNFSFALYLETQNSPQDIYKSNGFSVIATAT
jgi:hypothetical protein